MGFELLSRFRKRGSDDPPQVDSWPVFAFGKLPVYKDFISVGLKDDASSEFRDWLSNGFSRHWSSRDEFRASEIPLHAFLLRLPRSRKVAVGVLWGSHDQGGLRKFPFAVFSVLPPGKPESSPLAALDYLPVFEARGREIRRKYEAGGTLSEVHQELRGARIEVPVRTIDQIRSRLAESLSTPRVGPLARALFGEEARERWPALLAGLDGAARRGGNGAGAFRFPLADEPSPLRQLQLWVVRMSLASPDGRGPCGILYRTVGDVPCGVVFYRDLKAEDILLLHPAAAPTDFVEEIPPAPRREILQAESESEPEAAVAVSPSAAPETAPQAAATPSEPPQAAAVAEPAQTSPAATEVALMPGEALSPPQPMPAEAPPATSETPPEAPPAAAETPLSAALPAPEPPRPVTPAPPEGPAEPTPAREPEGWDLPLAALLTRD